ncbi:MAG: hypothetical protein ACFCBU_02080, partial [Cyanophyceae cyanobacterium]
MANSVSGLNLLVLLSMTGGLMSAADGAWAGQRFRPEPLADANSETLTPLHLNGVSEGLTPRSVNVSATQPDLSATTIPIDGLAQGEGSVVQITDIRVESTPTGVQVVLDADGQLAPPTPSVSGNALILELS